MKFEEILPYIREGRKFRKRHSDLIYDKDSSIALNLKYLLSDEYELVREKIKYYPALIEGPLNGFKITYDTFKDYEEARNNLHVNIRLIRLITEIPELIEEREE